MENAFFGPIMQCVSTYTATRLVTIKMVSHDGSELEDAVNCGIASCQSKEYLTCHWLTTLVTRQVAVYLETHCNISSKRVFPTGVLDR